MWGAVEREAHKAPCNTNDKQWAKITAGFTNLNKETVGKIFKKFRSRQEAVKQMVISLNKFNL